MLGDNIKFLRKKSRMTQASLASSLGVTQSSITAWENGVSEPGKKKLHEICKIFGVSEMDIQYTNLKLESPEEHMKITIDISEVPKTKEELAQFLKGFIWRDLLEK